MHFKLNRYLFLISLLLLVVVTSCAPEPPKREVALYNTYCASCHIAPRIDELPKDIWKNAILPDMLARMDIEEMYQEPNQVSTTFRPKIKLQDWIALQNYIIEMAPEKLAATPKLATSVLGQFKAKEVALDTLNGALLSYLDFDEDKKQLSYGTIAGDLQRCDFELQTQKKIYQGNTPVTWFNRTDSVQIITEVGILDPSDLEEGQLVRLVNEDTTIIQNGLHRPVGTVYEDLNGDGTMEMVVSEFGDATGSLSLLVANAAGSYDKTVLLNQPGCIKTLAKDMNNDGKLDIITMTTQGNESITILYQTDDLKFKAEKVIEFSPIYGSSWFELVDYNNDGFDDIITVNGDNADKSYVHKPYHGMRIHLNDGENNFPEAYFYPLKGATRVLARDFDQDGDLDFGLISTFPDYKQTPELSFVYLENLNAKSFDFASKVLKDANAGRWFLMDAGDIDSDGDEDIILSSFTYVFTPVPDELANRWANSNVDLVILENKLK